jgi:hypothetical protein
VCLDTLGTSGSGHECGKLRVFCRCFLAQEFAGVRRSWMCAWMPWGLAVVAMDMENCGYFAGISLHRSLQEFAGVGCVPGCLGDWR